MSDGYILNKELLEKKLKELAETPYTGELQYGAMCYSPAFPDIGEYICIVCNKKTEHVCGEFFIDKLIKSREIIRILISNGYDVQLDEREFCKYCNVNEIDYEPKPHLSIRFDENDNYRTSKAGLNSLKLLQAFLLGRDHILGAYDNTVALHESIDILCNMTGLCEETAKQWLVKIRNSADPRYEKVKWRTDGDFFED